MAPTIAGCCPSLQAQRQENGSSGSGNTEVVVGRRRRLSMDSWVCLPLLCPMLCPMRMGSTISPTSLCTREQESNADYSAADAARFSDDDESEPGFVGESGFTDSRRTEKHRIPELKVCPPAPRKPRAIARKRVQPIRFFNSPELEAFFSQYKLQVKF